jgi:hypothetical protein
MTLGSSDVLELVPGALYRLGGLVKLDGRISWAPREARGYQPINCYLVVEPGMATLIDTGPAFHEAQVTEQLRRALPPQARLSVFLTRAEYEGIGNLGAVHAAVGVDDLFSGGVPNIFDGYAEVPGFAEMWNRRTYISRIPPTASPAIGDSRRLHMLAAPLRVLATYWAYDNLTRTLFTSDVFGHTDCATASGSPVIERVSDDSSNYESVRAHVLAKFPWLAFGRVQTIRDALSAVFEKYEVEIIAPMHGSVLKGGEVVTRHYEFLQRLLAESDGSGRVTKVSVSQSVGPESSKQ